MYKIGDKVRCINHDGLASKFISCGGVYTVYSSRTNPGGIKMLMLDHVSGSWSEDRFEIVEYSMNTGTYESLDHRQQEIVDAVNEKFPPPVQSREPNACTCDMFSLMANGCQCGGV